MAAGKIAPFRTVQERCKNAEEHGKTSTKIMNGIRWQNGFMSTGGTSPRSRYATAPPPPPSGPSGPT